MYAIDRMKRIIQVNELLYMITLLFRPIRIYFQG